MSGSVGGVHDPRDFVEFAAWFPDDAACADDLAWPRWGDPGFECRRCGSLAHGWKRFDGLTWDCGECGGRTSVTTGHQPKLLAWLPCSQHSSR